MLIKINNTYGGFYINVDEVLVIEPCSTGKSLVVFKNGEEKTLTAAHEDWQDALIGEVEENENETIKACKNI